MEQKEKPNEALYQGEASFAPYSLTVSGPRIEAVDKSKLVASAHEAMQLQAEQQISMLRKQANLLMEQARQIEERLRISYQIYTATIGFEPVAGKVYHLYEKAGKKILAHVGPEEWGRSIPYDNYLATVRLMADKTWEVLKSEVEF